MIRSLIVTALAVSLYIAPNPVHASENNPQRAAVSVGGGTVTAVRSATRTVEIRGDNGKEIEFKAGPEVQNFAQIRSGDRVEIAYFESVAASMANPNDPGGAIRLNDAERNPAGGKPGLTAVQITNAVIEVIDYNPATAIVTYRVPSGDMRMLEVHPKMRDFAAARKPGDKVEVTIEQVFLVEVRAPATN